MGTPVDERTAVLYETLFLCSSLLTYKIKQGKATLRQTNEAARLECRFHMPTLAKMKPAAMVM